MEDSLDSIEEGQEAYVKVMSDFYQTYNSEHESALVNMENIRAEQRPSGLMCETCGKEMLISWGETDIFSDAPATRLHEHQGVHTATRREISVQLKKNRWKKPAKHARSAAPPW
jgi:hypothetical protein